MKAEELRLGNFVQTYVNGEWNDCVEVFEITEDELNGFKSYLREAEGIPLTEEWLTKFGFKVFAFRDYNFPSGLPGFLISERDYGYVFIHRDYSMDIKYVSQLQNLYYSLTGEELIIV